MFASARIVVGMIFALAVLRGLCLNHYGCCYLLLTEGCW